MHSSLFNLQTNSKEEGTRGGDTIMSDNSFVHLSAGLSSIHVQLHLAHPQQLPSVYSSGPELAWGRQ